MNLNKEFLVGVDYELERTKRYELNFSVLLLEIQNLFEENIKTAKFPSKTFQIKEFIEKELRGTDIVYAISPIKFGIILPCTYEMGAETVSLRLKKKIAHNFKDSSSLPAASCSGILSIDEHSKLTSRKIYDLLIDQLKREYRYQIWFNEITEISRRESGNIIVFTDDKSKYNSVQNAIEKKGYILYITNSLEDSVNTLNEKKQAVLVIDNQTHQYPDIIPILNNIQNQKKIKRFFILGVGCSEEIAAICDNKLPYNAEIEIIALNILKSMEYISLFQENIMLHQTKNALKTIRSMMHQAGQPMQVIMGRAEILLFKLSSGQTGEKDLEELVNSLEKIKIAVTELSDISQKTGRLAKLKNKD